uniref:Glycine zipper domain-containing protein n=1 Tax=Anopheles atroparvus TaxID=41427 RepID=A0AAG5DJR1_ANOAO
MCVHGSLIVLLSVAGTVVLGLALATPVPFERRNTPSGAAELVRQAPVVLLAPDRRGLQHRSVAEGTGGLEDLQSSVARARSRRRTQHPDESNMESSISLWEWLKGRDKPEDSCMLMAIGGVASGGFLTGAFVGAGIGSIFTGPGAIVGGIVGGLVGMFGGLSVGARAGAVACESV